MLLVNQRIVPDQNRVEKNLYSPSIRHAIKLLPIGYRQLADRIFKGTRSHIMVEVEQANMSTKES